LEAVNRTIFHESNLLKNNCRRVTVNNNFDANPLISPNELKSFELKKPTQIPSLRFEEGLGISLFFFEKSRSNV